MEFNSNLTYRTATRTTRHNDVDNGVRLKLIYAARRQKILSAGVATEDLKKDRDRRGSILNVVDGEASGSVLRRHKHVSEMIPD